MSQIPSVVHTTKAPSLKVWRHAYIVDPESKRLVSGRNFEVDRANPVVEGRYVLPVGLSPDKQWYLDEDGQPQEYTPEQDALASARIETQKRAKAGGELNIEINARLRALALNSADSLAVLTIAAPIQAMIAAGSFATALSTLQAAELSIPASANTAYDFAVAELQKLVAEFDGGA